ncbi:hypothetical protein N7457_009033 [Penicillium paradoxum]|uniref:uncharacterized protein n=1 Tax=Penicillium paradoxum TaxID=176176 RepID=UPI00254828C0|nr:uncharacterized protein N7457_009033 [Penicillium paradoxum]KAJ5774137.1 hypothetical protein N7457_009033 [Penicillium paradoxum]
MDNVFARNYEPVPKTEADGDSDTTMTNKPPRRGVQQFLKRNLAAITITGLLMVLFLLVLAVIAAITMEPLRQVLAMKDPSSSLAYPDTLKGQRQCLPPTPRIRYSCGNSTEEARKLGCTYDPLAGCWLHEECPHDFTHEFAHFHNGKPFVYFYDEEATKPMKDYTEVGDNPDFYWTEVREHLVHCLYLLRRGHDVHMRGDRLDNMLGDLEHVDHCTNMLANWLRRPDPALDKVGTQGFTHCFMSCS